jgi:hypothetical protein
MAQQAKTVGVVYVGPHNEVDISVTPGITAEYGIVTEVPPEVAKELLKQKDNWQKAGHRADPKRRAHARAVTAAEHGGEYPGPDKAKDGVWYEAAQNNPEDQPEAQYVEPNIESGDPNPSPEAPHVGEPAKTDGGTK